MGPRTLVAQTNGERAALFQGFTVLAGTPAFAGTTVSTLAGTGTPGLTDGPGGTAQFAFPGDVAARPDGSAVVADTGNSTLRALAGDGTTSTVPLPVSVLLPAGVTLDAAGRTVIADTARCVIRLVQGDGTVTTIGSGTCGFADGGPTVARFNLPRAVSSDAAGNLYVADTGNFRVRKIDPQGTVTTLAGAGTFGNADGPAATATFGLLAGIAVAPDGTVFVSDAVFHKIRQIDPSGTVSTVAGTGVAGFADGPAASSQFAFPAGLTRDNAGNLYLADTGNNLARRLTPAGQVETVAGTGASGSQDGPGATATFTWPAGVGAAPGAILVADTFSHKIRRVQVGPELTGLTPTSGVHGETLTLTVTGTNLAGATALTFLKDGTPDPHITVTDLQVNAQGTALQATVAISGLAALGSRLVQVTTPGGTSAETASAANTFTVLGRLSLIPDFVSLAEGQTGTLTVQLSAPAPAGDLPVTLESAAPGIASLPPSVTVPAGATSAPTTVTGVSEGTTNLTASTPGFAPGQSTVTVRVPVPALTGFTPSSGKVGTTVGLTGTGFRSTPSANSVSFAGPTTRVAAPVTAATATALTVTVPGGAVTGPLQVTTSGGTATSTGTFIVLPTLDVALTVEPTTVTAIAGTSVSLKVTTSTTGGFTGLTTLATGTLPAGVTATFTPPALGPNASSILTLTTAGETPGTNSIEIRGTASIEGTAVTRTATATLTVQAPSGQTTLLGRILDEDAQPIPGVTVRIGSLSTTTDAAGNFLLADPPAGTQLVFLDGSTATVPGTAYPTIVLTMTIQAGVSNVLPYQPYLHAQKAQHFVDISNASVARVLTDPEIPGFTMTIPAGVTIIGWDGQPNQVVSVRTVPIDRLPIPPPPPQVNGKTVYMFYFNKPGGGVPSQPIPITAPNELELLPGDEANLWYFDEAPDGSRPNAWAIAGAMTVSSDGQHLITKPGVGIPRFCCGAMVLATRALNRARNERQQAPPSRPECPECNDPVQMGTGLYIRTTTDLVLPGRMPLAITRTYRTLDPSPGPFGRGTTWPYDIDLLVSIGQYAVLITPGNARATLSSQPDGSYLNTTELWLRGARLTAVSSGYVLRFKDGTQWSFTGQGLLTAIADRNGNRIRLERTWDFKLAWIQDSANRAIELTKDSQDRITQLRDPLGRTVRYTYNGAGYLETVTDPAGGITRYTYDAQGRMLTVTDPRNTIVVTNEYDSAGRVSRQTYADGSVWTYAYTTAGGLITETRMTDPYGHVTTFRFNPGSYPTQYTDALGQRTISQRAIGTNELLAKADALGRTTQYTYDAAGNVTRITDPLNNSRAFTYDPTFNKVTSITDPLGNLTTFEYDAQGNLIAMTDPEQNKKPEPERLKTRMTYNQFGQVLTTTDPLGNTTTFEYDDVGNLIAIVDPLGNRTERMYDTASRLIAMKDPKGAVARFAYDPLDRLVSTTDPLGGITRFTYDPNGNLLTVTDARGNTTSHEYDARNRLQTRTDPLGRAETFTYDGNGNLKTATDRKGQTTTHTYDAQNRRTRTEFADGSSLTYAYDSAGNLLTATDSLTGTIARTYDPLNRLAEEVTPQGAITYGYDQVGRRQTMQVNGLQPVVYGYDANSRLTEILQGPQTATIAYDEANRQTALTLPNGVTVTYTYDEASRLVAQNYIGPQGSLGNLTYTYNANGNRAGTGGTRARSGIPAGVASTNYDVANQQLAFGNITQIFDANGNLQTQADANGTTTYTWDARNRLVATNGPNVNASFSYDAFGRRIAKTINGTATVLQYDEADTVRENGSAGDATYLRTLAIDDTLARTDANGTVAYLTDILGNIIALVDPAGTPITEYGYEPFGVTLTSVVNLTLLYIWRSWPRCARPAHSRQRPGDSDCGCRDSP